ncbi:MAG: hypothetical protein WCW40_02470 [Bacteroidota bacterium]
MPDFNINFSDREVFEYLLRIALDNAEIKQQLIHILSSENVGRKEMLDVLLKHTKLQSAPDGMKKVFTYFQDDLFATEVLQYLQKS